MRGKSSSHRAYYRIFRAGTKGGTRGRDLGDFGRNKSGKIEGQGDKKGQSHVK